MKRTKNPSGYMLLMLVFMTPFKDANIQQEILKYDLKSFLCSTFLAKQTENASTTI